MSEPILVTLTFEGRTTSFELAPHEADAIVSFDRQLYLWCDTSHRAAPVVEKLADALLALKEKPNG